MTTGKKVLIGGAAALVLVAAFQAGQDAEKAEPTAQATTTTVLATVAPATTVAPVETTQPPVTTTQPPVTTTTEKAIDWDNPDEVIDIAMGITQTYSLNEWPNEPTWADVNNRAFFVETAGIVCEMYAVSGYDIDATLFFVLEAVKEGWYPWNTTADQDVMSFFTGAIYEHYCPLVTN